MSIYYKSLLILDKGKNVARKIEFRPGINIVTSHLNSVGKTSLSLMLLHSFGAKVRFSDKWDLSNVFTKLTIQKDSREIKIIRHRDTYTIITGDEKYFYPVQKNGYAEKLYELLGLTIKIKDKNSDTYSTAIPSLYLLPYFLSQTKTDEDRSVFEDLSMYLKSDLRDALYYHVGALDNNYSSVVQQLTQTRKKLEVLRKSREKQISEIEYLERKLAESKNAKLIDSDVDLDADIAVYQKYSKKKQDYYSLVKTQSDIKHKIKLLNATLKDNSVYTAKLLDGEDIICPVCNSNITDFISSALKVGIAESDINAELASLKADLLATDRKIALAKPTLNALHREIMLIEQQRENVKVTRAIIVWNEELSAAKASFAETQLQIDSLEALIKGYSETVRSYNEKKQSADKSYRASFASLLNATNISTDGLDISSLNLYDSLHLSGSEIPRVAISRFFSLLESKTAESIVMPIIFDFPNLDMTEENLTKCFRVMCEKISDTKTYPQSFIFSINCEERISKAGASLENANIIDIERLPMDDSVNPKLLCKHDYSAYSKEISEMINA
mgnify:CR=1 FL=1|jgi:hypothetical protein